MKVYLWIDIKKQLVNAYQLNDKDVKFKTQNDIDVISVYIFYESLFMDEH